MILALNRNNAQNLTKTAGNNGYNSQKSKRYNKFLKAQKNIKKTP